MTDCIFCQIVEGEIPSRTVYEDDYVMAFLDVNPLSRGHTVVIPKNHFENLQEMDDPDASAVYSALHNLVEPVTDAVGTSSCNVGINNGEPAGQEIPHVHFHIVPRFEGDGGGAIHTIMRSTLDIEDEELDEIGDEIRERV
ncbi:MAG: HIT family protein [Halobacteria archaeon]|nr:HIT family protein [Halobacteria archaeon]